VNKLTIPVILVATVLIAGIFAFMPVEKAQTVHDILLASGVQFRTLSDTCTSTGTTNDCLITISSDKDYLVWDISVDMSAWDAGDTVQVEDFAIGGVNFLEAVDTNIRTYNGDQTIDLKTFEVQRCLLTCDQDGIPAQGGTDITFELDITALDEAPESIPITVTFLTAPDAIIDVTITSITA